MRIKVMDGNTKFVIRRRDLDLHLDEAMLQNECLLIGRDSGNDLVLNHPDIPQAQAGIIHYNGKYWLGGLPSGVLVQLNSKPLRPPIQLRDGDKLVMGPYCLEVERQEGPLLLTVMMKPELTPPEYPVKLIRTRGKGDNWARGSRKNPVDPATASILTSRLDSKLGKLNVKSQLEPDDLDSYLARYQEKIPKDLKAALSKNRRAKAQFDALSRSKRARYVRWVDEVEDADQRAAIIDHLLSALANGERPEEGTVPAPPNHSNGEQKPQRHPRNQKVPLESWRPTLDLREYKRRFYYFSGIILIFAFLLGIYCFYERWFSPGPVAHDVLATDAATLTRRNIAHRPSIGSCDDCHVGQLQNQCSFCHTTQQTRDRASGQIKSAFQPFIYEAHSREGLSCVTCHKEHKDQPELLSYQVCASCHNDTYLIKTGERIGKPLGVPHGGEVGYPVKEGRWVWPGLTAERWGKKDFPRSSALYSSLDQFHILHRKGFLCVDCHTVGVRTEEGLYQSPRAECAKCHAMPLTGGSINDRRVNCSTCHQQHGQSRDMAWLKSPEEVSEVSIMQYVARLRNGQESDGGTALEKASVYAGTQGVKYPAPVSSSRFWHPVIVIIGLLLAAGAAFMIAQFISRRRILTPYAKEKEAV